jgi:1,2-diacylglycerol 3-beta-galactosyltransferase
MPQERYNTTWVEENQLGQVIGSVSELPGAVAAVLSDLPKFRQNVQDINNQAVFEVVEALAQISHDKSVNRC